MRAIVCTKYGSPDVLELQELAKPTPKEDEVLVKVSTTSVTAGDSRMRSFTVPPSFWLPARLALGIRKPKKSVLGMELAGEVESVGKNVKWFKKGDPVFGEDGALPAAICPRPAAAGCAGHPGERKWLIPAPPW